MKHAIVQWMLPAVIALLSCASPLPLIKIVPLPVEGDIVLGPENRSSSLSTGGVTINATGLDPQELSKYSVVLKPIRPEDFGALSKDGYVNYAAADNAELISQYRLGQTYPRELKYNALSQAIGDDGWEVNPYLEKKNELLVFRVVVENKSAQKIGLDPAQCVIVDDQNRQYAALTKNDWRGFAPLVWSSNFVLVTYGHSYQLAHYFVPRETALNDISMEQTLLGVPKVFPGVTQEGLLMFSMLPPEVREIKLILPEVTFYNDNNEVIKKQDFAYRFKIVRSPTK